MRKKIIIILGMHRSGTSLLTSVFHKIGYFTGDNLKQAKQDNVKGFFEDADVSNLNDEILTHLNLNWDSCQKLTKIIKPCDLPNSFFQKASNLINLKISNVNNFVIKDPRSLLTIFFWRDVFESNKYDVNFVGIVRHPLEVAESLKKRDSFPYAKSFLLWLRYNYCLINFHNNCKITILTFNELFNEVKITNKLKKLFNSQSNSPEVNCFDKNLVHHYSSKNDDFFAKNDLIYSVCVKIYFFIRYGCFHIPFTKTICLLFIRSFLSRMTLFGIMTDEYSTERFRNK